MLSFIILLALFIIAYAFAIKHQLKTEQESIDEILKSENSIHDGATTTVDDISFYCEAVYQGGYTKFPGSFKANIRAVKSAIYIQSIANPGLKFRIDKELLTDFGVFSPSIPYVMNLDMAGLFANEMTRKQIGNSVYIDFIDDIGIKHTIQLGEFNKERAESFVAYIYAEIEQILIGKGISV